MELTLEKISLYTLKGVAGLVTLFALFRLAFESVDGLFGIFIVFLSGTAAIYVLIWNAMIFTNSKGLQNFGAFGAVITALILIGVVMYTVLKGESLEFLTDSGWNMIQYLLQILLGLVAGFYLSLANGGKVALLERLILIAIIPAFIAMELTSPFKEDGFDYLRGWESEAIVTIALMVAIYLVVLFFSDLLHAIVVPLFVALVAFVADATMVKRYLLDTGSGSSEDVFSYSLDFREFFSPTIFLRLVISSALLGYCIYLLWRTRKTDSDVGNVGYVPTSNYEPAVASTQTNEYPSNQSAPSQDTGYANNDFSNPPNSSNPWS